MNAHSYALTKGLQSLKQLAEVTGTTQKRLRELYVSDPQVFDALCESAFHKLQTDIFLDSMLRHRAAIVA